MLGIRDSGSAVRAGLVHYNDRSDVDRLLTARGGAGRLTARAGPAVRRGRPVRERVPVHPGVADVKPSLS